MTNEIWLWSNEKVGIRKSFKTRDKKIWLVPEHQIIEKLLLVSESAHNPTACIQRETFACFHGQNSLKKNKVVNIAIPLHCKYKWCKLFCYLQLFCLCLETTPPMSSIAIWFVVGRSTPAHRSKYIAIYNNKVGSVFSALDFKFCHMGLIHAIRI